MGFRQQGQSRNALRLELVGDEIQKCGASPFGCLGDGASEKDFVVELAGVAVVELAAGDAAPGRGRCLAIAIFANGGGEPVFEVGVEAVLRLA